MTLEFLHTKLMKFNRLVSIDKLYKFSCFKTFLNETILPNLLVQYIKIPQNTTEFWTKQLAAYIFLIIQIKKTINTGNNFKLETST